MFKTSSPICCCQLFDLCLRTSIQTDSDPRKDVKSIVSPTTSFLQHLVLGVKDTEMAQTLFLPLFSKEILPEIFKIDNSIT